MKLTILRITAIVGSIAFGVAGASRSYAQATSTTGPAFEVASVKPNKSGDGRINIGFRPGGQFTATNTPLRLLIRNAYLIQDVQLVGGPDWVGSNRFDIIAKAEGDVPLAPPGTAGPMQLMLRALLAERFKLAVHNETRELPIYALVVARSDGKLGEKVRPATVDCAAIFAAARARGGQPPPPPNPGERMPCGSRIGPGVLNAGSFSLSQLSVTLSQIVNRTVVDRTGLTGNFDFDLLWTPDQLPQRAPGTPADQPLRTNGAEIDPNGPSIFTALQEQLGLKLESQRGPVEVLVIDRVEQPTAD